MSCSGAGTDRDTAADEAPATTGREPISTAASGQQDLASDGDDRVEPRRYPVDSFFYGDGPDGPVSVEAQRELVVVACMVEAGFDYGFVDWDVINAAVERDLAAAGRSDAAAHGGFVPGHGYGYAEGVTGDGAVATKIPDGADPNVAVYESLSESDRRAWDEHYAGCSLRSHQEVTDVVIPVTVAEELAAIDDQVAADPRVISAEDAWSVCMAGNGFSFPDREALFTELAEMQAPLLAAAAAAGGTESLPADVEAGVDRLLSYELEVGDAEAGCFPPLDETVYEVTVARQEDYLEANADRIALLQQEAGEGDTTTGSTLG